MCESTVNCTFRDEFTGKVIGVGICVEGVCKCSTYMGFRGDTCSDVSPQVISGIVIELVSVFGQLVLMFVTLALIYQTRRILNSEYDGESRPTLNTNMFVLFLVLFCTLSIGGQSLVFVNTLLNPDQVKVVDDSDLRDEYLTVESSDMYALLIIIVPVAFSLATLLICLSWLQLLEELSDVLPIKHIQRISALKTFLKYIIIFGLISIISLTALPFDLSTYIAILIGAIDIFTMILVLIGWRYLINILKKMSLVKMRKSIVTVSNLALAFLIIHMLTIIQLIWTQALDIRIRTSSNEEFDVASFFAKISRNVLYFTALVPLLIYCNTINKNLKSVTKQTKRESYITTSAVNSHNI